MKNLKGTTCQQNHLDKTKLFVFHSTPQMSLHGQPLDPVFVTFTPVVVWEKVEFFYQNIALLESHAQFNFKNEDALKKCVLPFYIQEGVVDTNFKDYMIFDGAKVKSLFPFVELDNLLSVATLETFGGVIFVDDNGIVDENIFGKVCSQYSQRCNEIIFILNKIDSKKFLLPTPVDIKQVQPNKFVTAKAKGVGFGNAHYIVYDDKSLIIDFGGLNYTRPDFRDFAMDQKENYIVLTHWHIDHYCNFSYLDFSHQKPVHFLAPVQFYGLAELYVIFRLAQVVTTVNLIPMSPDYATRPQYMIDPGIFVYGSKYADYIFDKNPKTGHNEMYIDLNSACLFIVNPVAPGVINLYSGDQKYDYMKPALENFSQKFAISSIDLLHATHHGLQAAPLTNNYEKISLVLNGTEIKGNVAVIPNDFGRFKANHEHALFLQNNFKNVITTYYNDVIASYTNSSPVCQILLTNSQNNKS